MKDKLDKCPRSLLILSLQSFLLVTIYFSYLQIHIFIAGIPNAGKSTLVNKLVGGNACPHSKKAHTTRFSTRAVLTEGDTQLVFSDTPGVVKPKEVKKFKLEQSLVSNPVESAKSADLIVVLQGTYFLLFSFPNFSVLY